MTIDEKKTSQSWLERFWRETAKPFAILLVVVFGFRSAFADWNDVPTGSMKPTILEGDRVVVNKVAYDLKVPFTLIRLAEWDDPKRGDIVVFYSHYDGNRLVKRVIGLPGDRIEMRDEVLFVNGEAIPMQDFKAHGRDAFVGREKLGDVEHSVRLLRGENGALTNFGPTTIAPETYFVMGDNRDESFDSRYFGPVPRKRIVGRATSVAFSLDRGNYFVPRIDRFFTGLR